LTITKHAKERLAERFKIRAESEIRKAVRKLEYDFIRSETKGGNEYRTITWKGQYLQGVICNNNLVTVVCKGWETTYFLAKWNPNLKEGKDRYRNRRRKTKKHEKAIYRGTNRTMR